MMSSFVVLLLVRATFISRTISGEVSLLITCIASNGGYIASGFKITSDSGGGVFLSYYVVASSCYHSSLSVL